jgi:hypothetical protein
MKTVAVIVLSLLTALFYVVRIWLKLPKKAPLDERKKMPIE